MKKFIAASVVSLVALQQIPSVAEEKPTPATESRVYVGTYKTGAPVMVRLKPSGSIDYCAQRILKSGERRPPTWAAGVKKHGDENAFHFQKGRSRFALRKLSPSSYQLQVLYRKGLGTKGYAPYGEPITLKKITPAGRKLCQFE